MQETVLILLISLSLSLSHTHTHTHTHSKTYTFSVNHTSCITHIYTRKLHSLFIFQYLLLRALTDLTNSLLGNFSLIYTHSHFISLFLLWRKFLSLSFFENRKSEKRCRSMTNKDQIIRRERKREKMKWNGAFSSFSFEAENINKSL